MPIVDNDIKNQRLSECIVDNSIIYQNVVFDGYYPQVTFTSGLNGLAGTMFTSDETAIVAEDFSLPATFTVGVTTVDMVLQERIGFGDTNFWNGDYITCFNYKDGINNGDLNYAVLRVETASFSEGLSSITATIMAGEANSVFSRGDVFYKIGWDTGTNIKDGYRIYVDGQRILTDNGNWGASTPTDEGDALFNVYMDERTDGIDSSYNYLQIGYTAPTSEYHYGAITMYYTFGDGFKWFWHFGEIMRISTGGDIIVNNDQTQDTDFIIKGYTNADLFYVDTSLDRIGVGTSSPSHLLDVNGDINFAGALKRDGSDIIDTNGYILPVSSTDASAPNNSIYYSTTQSRLVYKDSGGTVNNLY